MKVNRCYLSVLLILLLAGCKLLKGNSSEGDCITPEQCYEEYLACPDEELDHEQTDISASLGHTASYRAYAQGFQLEEARRIKSVSLALSTLNAPSGELQIEIREDCSGNPCPNRYIQISNPVSLRDLYPAADETELNFEFEDMVWLEAQTQYYIQITVDLTDQTSKSFYVHYSNTTAYDGGRLKTKSDEDGTWGNYSETIDLFFKINTCID